MSNFLDFDDEESPNVHAGQNAKPRAGTSIKNFIDTDYKDFAFYVLEQRAIPSVIDGFKTSQRKLFYAMQSYRNKRVKLAELGGSLSSIGYAHGETSANDAAVRMARAWSNNIPAFIGHGNFGSRMIQDAAAARYIYATMNPKADAIFIDNDVLVKNADPEDKEPHHFLPAIPWLLVNGASGIAVGFKSEILPRDPKLLVKACVEYIETGKVRTELMPHFPGFKGEVKRTEENKFMTFGVIEKGLRNSYVITELPWAFDRQKYFEILAGLVEAGKISDFEDHCDKSGFKFIVKMNIDQRADAEKDIYRYLKLYETYSEIFTTLDEKGKIKIFKNVEDIIAYFCDYRIKKKRDQREFEANKIRDQIDFLQSKIKFIKTAIDQGVGIISKMTKQELKIWTTDLIGKPTYTDQLVRIPVYEFTTDEVDALLAELESCETKLQMHISIKAEDALIQNMKECMKK